MSEERQSLRRFIVTASLSLILLLLLLGPSVYAQGIPKSFLDWAIIKKLTVTTGGADFQSAVTADDVTVNGDLVADDVTVGGILDLDGGVITDVGTLNVTDVVSQSTNLELTGALTSSTAAITTANVSALTATTFVATTASATTGTVTDLTATTGTVTSLTATAATITTADATTLTATTANVTTGTVTSLTATSGDISSLTATTATITHIAGRSAMVRIQDAAIANEYTNIMAATDVASATTSITSSSLTQPDYPRSVIISYTTTTTATTGTLAVAGVDARGTSTSEDLSVLAISGTQTITGSVPWASITSFTLPTRTEAITFSVGTGNALGLPIVPSASADVFMVTKNNVYTTAYTVDTTYGTVAPTVAVAANDDFSIWLKQ